MKGDTMGNFIELINGYNWFSVLFRLAASVLCGGIIGFDRGRKRRPAGFRTHMIVCLGAALTMLISQHMFWRGYTTDLSRLGAQVVSGIGFLGAGTIIVTGRQQIKGLTTAAGLWASACMGLAIGAGFYFGALVGFLLILLTMSALTYIEGKVIASARNMNIYVEYSSSTDIGIVIDGIKKLDVKIYDIEIRRSKAAEGVYPNSIISLKLPKGMPHAVLMAEVASSKGVRSVEEV